MTAPFLQMPGPRRSPRQIARFFRYAAVRQQLHLYVARTHGRYGPLVRLPRPFRGLVSVAEPDLLQALHRMTDPAIGRDQPGLAIGDGGYYVGRFSRHVQRSTVSLASGAAQSDHRQVILDLLRARHEDSPPIMRRHAALLADAWAAGARSGEAHRNVWNELRALFLDTFLETIFSEGVRGVYDSAELLRTLRGYLRWVVLVQGGPMPLKRAILRAGVVQKHAGHLRDVIARMSRCDERSFEWQRMGEARGWSGDEVMEELLDVVVAGHDAPANAMAAILFELAKSPDTQDALRQDLAASNRERSPYLAAVINECYRLHTPVALLPRFCSQDAALGGYHIPLGTTVLGAYAAANRDSRWDQPERWRPERFLTSEHPPLFRPFGAGSRRCVGMSYTDVNLAAALAYLVPRFRFELARRHQELDSRHDVTTGPKWHGLPLRIEALRIDPLRVDPLRSK